MEYADRKNSGKPQMSFIALDCLEDCARVLEFGSKKYERDNWRKGMPMSELLDSLLRHVGQLLKGEYYDQESGLSHIGHIQANAMFLGNTANNEANINFTAKESSRGSLQNCRVGRSYKKRGGDLVEVVGRIMKTGPEITKEFQDVWKRDVKSIGD